MIQLQVIKELPRLRGLDEARHLLTMLTPAKHSDLTTLVPVAQPAKVARIKGRYLYDLKESVFPHSHRQSGKSFVADKWICGFSYLFIA